MTSYPIRLAAFMPPSPRAEGSMNGEQGNAAANPIPPNSVPPSAPRAMRCPWRVNKKQPRRQPMHTTAPRHNPRNSMSTDLTAASVDAARQNTGVAMNNPGYSLLPEAPDFSLPPPALESTWTPDTESSIGHDGERYTAARESPERYSGIDIPIEDLQSAVLKRGDSPGSQEEISSLSSSTLSTGANGSVESFARSQPQQVVNRVWISEQEKLKKEYKRIKTHARHVGVFDSPYFPKDEVAYLRLQTEIKSARLREMERKLAEMKLEYNRKKEQLVTTYVEVHNALLGGHCSVAEETRAIYRDHNEVQEQTADEDRDTGRPSSHDGNNTIVPSHHNRADAPPRALARALGARLGDVVRSAIARKARNAGIAEQSNASELRQLVSQVPGAANSMNGGRPRVENGSRVPTLVDTGYQVRATEPIHPTPERVTWPTVAELQQEYSRCMCVSYHSSSFPLPPPFPGFDRYETSHWCSAPLFRIPAAAPGIPNIKDCPANPCDEESFTTPPCWAI
ncbi:hypothetical protein QBC46DRAFT_402494 [Diplogelasinospora grovesii]|uniref:Uncharacterized protein n=1 Tax=Diplogelasinospora grovesii TaxID=303347 RepID=A0AAN6S9K6_9PEZI|nr:hypothetical protein QBC46DRAFT_402494 [Diplogelasinospora grovesii]